MENLDPATEDFIEAVSTTVNKELQYVKDNDWTKVKNFKPRETMHDLQILLTKNNLDNAKKLFSLCNNEVGHPKVKSMMKKLMSFQTIYRERANKYNRSQDWSTFIDDESKSKGDMEEEIKFQSEINKNVTKFGGDSRKINDGDSIVSLSLPIWNEEPVPFMMKEIIEQKYPEVLKYVENKNKKDEQTESK
ncbi:MAG: hypothetical protein WD512_13135 [Candidatus Paceibacterota bacterium]